MPTANSAARKVRGGSAANARRNAAAPARSGTARARASGGAVAPAAPIRRKPAVARKAGGRSRARASPRGAVMGSQPAYFVLIPTVALLLLGLVMVFSAGYADSVMGGTGYLFFVKQVAWAVIGVALLFLFARLDYHRLGKISWVFVLLSLGLLLAVLISGRVAGGARRWLEVGPLDLQPTEMAKFATVIFAAYALAVKGDRVRKLQHVLIPVIALAGFEALLILGQPDLGSAIILCLCVMLVVGLARTKPGHLALIGATGGGAAVILMLAAPYRRARVFSFLNPWRNPRGYGYHVIQSYIALGSGHIKGVGLGMSRQKYLYLPNAHTDFIFAIIGEELGLLGTVLVVALVALFLYGGMKIASRAPDELGRLLAAGITGLITIQALVNMGGVTGLLPITGVPLPLVSSGGSSLCVCMGCIGILLNIAAQGARQR